MALDKIAINGTNVVDETTTFPKVIKFASLKERNPEYMGDYWKQCRALYAGGPSLLNDSSILKAVMPKHNAEEEDVYKERLKRAFYIPYAGAIIDMIVSELTGKPLVVEKAPTVEEIHINGSKTTQGEGELDDYYKSFFKDCSKPGGRKQSINQLVREQVLTALQCRSAWTLIDMPQEPEVPYVNRQEQEKAGGLNVYACAIAPENVIDWECDESGEFLFVLIQECVNERKALTSNRNEVTLRWRYYTPDAWAVYELTYDKVKMPDGPKDTMEAKRVGFGKHGFERVPVRRMRLSDGLWAMGKLEAMARAHLNQRNALSWGQLKSLFPMPVLYAGAPDPQNPVSEETGRAGQKAGPGYIWVLNGGSKNNPGDKLEYFSPDPGPFKVAQEDLNNIRDEMHRVLHHMALSIDNSGAALQRSADSKAIDQVAASTVLKALGGIVREHVEDIYTTVAAGRKEKDLTFAAKGMDQFDDTNSTQVVTDAMTLESIDIPSATFQRKRKMKVVKSVLGADATPDELQEIEDELEEAITPEMYEKKAEADEMDQEARVANADRTIKGEPLPGAQPGVGKPGVKPKPLKSKKPVSKPSKKNPKPKRK